MTRPALWVPKNFPTHHLIQQVPPLKQSVKLLRLFQPGDLKHIDWLLVVCSLWKEMVLKRFLFNFGVVLLVFVGMSFGSTFQFGEKNPWYSSEDDRMMMKHGWYMETSFVWSFIQKQRIIWISWLWRISAGCQLVGSQIKPEKFQVVQMISASTDNKFWTLYTTVVPSLKHSKVEEWWSNDSYEIIRNDTRCFETGTSEWWNK